MKRTAARIAIAAAIAISLVAAAAVTGATPEPAPPAGRAPVPAADTFLASPAGAPAGEAIAALQARLTEVPGDWRAAAALGTAAVQQARITADPALYGVAADALGRSLALRPEGNPDALVGLGALAAARHRFGEALGWGRRAAREAPADPEAHAVVADALVELGRYRAATRAIQRAVDLRPDLGSFARVSYLLELRGDVAGALRAMRAAYGLAAGRTDAAWAAAHVGTLHLGAGRRTEAARWLRIARAADPASREATAGLATLAWTRGDLDLAIAGFERLVAAYPAPAHLGTLADLYRAAGDHEAARAVEGTVRAEVRLLEAAGARAGVEVALFDADHGRPREALAEARAEWERRRSVQVADALAWALHVNGRDREAARFADRALRLGTRDASFLFHAGMIRLALGDRGRALELLRRARTTNPWFSVRWSPVLERVLDRLEAGGPGA